MAINTLRLKKNDSDVAHYNFNAHQQILAIFGRHILSSLVNGMFTNKSDIENVSFLPSQFRSQLRT